jgi:hypothetical protein
MRLSGRLHVLVGGVVAALMFGAPFTVPSAQARVDGAAKRYVKINLSDVGTKDTEDGLEATAFIDGGHPYAALCVSPEGLQKESTREEVVKETTVVKEEDPETGIVTEKEQTVGTQTWRVVQLKCGNREWESEVCIAATGTMTCPPRRGEPIDGEDVAKRATQRMPWVPINPQFRPNVLGKGRYDFALTQAPLFFWVPVDVWDKPLEVHASACNLDGDCSYASIRARPDRLVFLPSREDRSVERDCRPPNTYKPVFSSSDYDGMTTDRKACKYTFSHSSTTKSGRSHDAEIGIQYTIFRSWWTEIDGFRQGVFDVEELEYGWLIAEEFDMRVGEVQALSGAPRQSKKDDD